jgi:hypothetical protein
VFYTAGNKTNINNVCKASWCIKFYSLNIRKQVSQMMQFQ